MTKVFAKFLHTFLFIRGKRFLHSLTLYGVTERQYAVIADVLAVAHSDLITSPQHLGIVEPAMRSELLIRGTSPSSRSRRTAPSAPVRERLLRSGSIFVDCTYALNIIDAPGCHAFLLVRSKSTQAFASAYAFWRDPSHFLPLFVS